MVSKLSLSVIVSIILTAIIVSTVNVGVSLFLDEPKYEDFCSYDMGNSLIDDDAITKQLCEDNNGTWMPKPIQCIKEPCPQGYCDFYPKCQETYEDVQKPYNQYKFYIFAGIGFLLLIIGLFAIENLIQITGLATGGILVLQGIMSNLENKIIVFSTLIAILLIFGILAWRVINRHENK